MQSGHGEGVLDARHLLRLSLVAVTNRGPDRARVAAARGVLLALALGATIVGCSKKNPTAPAPENHNPVISSVVLFPQTIGPGDSVIVVCTASDPDGDSLVYDWITDTRLRVKGSPFGAYLFSSNSNAQVFYYGTPPMPTDTAWIKCFARDLRGGSDGRMLFLPMHP